jgi:hypothetical protein
MEAIHKIDYGWNYLLRIREVIAGNTMDDFTRWVNYQAMINYLNKKKTEKYFKSYNIKRNPCQNKSLDCLTNK